MRDSGVRGRAATLAVVDANHRDVWVWWINTALDAEWVMSRKVGAWQLALKSDAFADHLEALIFERMVVATKAGRQVINVAGITGTKWVDLAATLEAVTLIRDEYQQLFDIEQSTRINSKRMRELQWPPLPQPIDLETPPPARGQFADAKVGKTLAIAAWVEQLVGTFQDIEAIRAERAALRDAFPARDFPASLP